MHNFRRRCIMRILIFLVLIICCWPSCPVLAEESSYDTVVFCCSEPIPELKAIFTEDLGRVVVVRNMGNVIGVAGDKPDHIEIGSVEYAIEHGAKRIIVLGHKWCGVIKSVMDNPTGGGHQQAIYAVISKSITKARKESSDLEVIWQKSIEYNIKNTVTELRENRFILHELVEAGKLEVTDAVYNPETGKVEPCAE
ncbi:MAG: carbonic anhydrase [bacterium]|nr:carbonic anhydrase [bacterium]